MAGMIAAALSISAFAAEVSGLRAFLDTNSYWSGVFSDVVAGSWYESGVKTVYEKGIMSGVSGNSFSPSDTVTWAQAVTIAARIHSIYHGTEIPTGTGAWYANYVDYAKEKGILPTSVPDGDAVASEMISRQELAGLFRSVLSESDLPVVNNADISDLKEALPEFQTAVDDLCAAGIFAGKSGGNFDPNGQATRAEVAVVVTRLLYPDQRVSFDGAADQNMAAQWGNYKSGGFAARLGDVTYYTAKERVDLENWKYSIVARTDSGETRTVYETSGSLTRLAAADNGMLYFVEDRARLMMLDPVSGNATQLYKSPVSVEHFVFYDGKVYVFDCYSQSGNIDDWKYRIGRVETNSLVILVNNMAYGKVSDLDLLHAFGGKLYYSYGEETYTSVGKTFYRHTIWALDLESGKTARVYGDNLYMGDVCFNGATYWHFGENEVGRYEIVRGNLLMPEYEMVLAVLPESAMKLYNHLYANGNRVFYQSSGAARVWEIKNNGDVREFAKLPTTYYEKSSVTEQGIILHALEGLSSLLPHQITVQLPDGSGENYLQFLGLPYWQGGGARYEEAEDAVIWLDNTVTEGEVTIEAEKAYSTVEGDLVVEVSVCNGLPEPISIVVFNLTISSGEQQVSVFFYTLDTVSAGEECLFSIFIPADRIGGSVDVETMETDILLRYNKQG